jgi:hypothetical protein
VTQHTAVRTYIVGRRGDIPITNDTVSEQHARLESHEGRWRLVDLASKNGTWLVEGANYDRHQDGFVSLDQPIAFGAYRTTVRALLKEIGTLAAGRDGTSTGAHEGPLVRCLRCALPIPASSEVCPECKSPTHP